MEGQVLGGRYEMGERLGAPGRRAVWTAYDRQDGRTVAVQVLVGAVPAPEELDRAAERVRAAAEGVDDTHLVVVRDLGPVDGGLFLVTDHVAGRGLDEVLAAEGTPAPALAVDRARQVCAGLAAAQAAGLVHGDLKPANLLVTADGTVKLLGLGVAGLRPAPGQDGAGGGDTALGSVPWMAPELVRGGEPADHRSDLYAVGCLLYQLLTGTTPFGHREVTLQFGAHLRETPVPPSRHRPGLPAGLDTLVLGLLAKDPAERPQSAAEVAAQLRGLAVEAAAVAGPGAGGFPTGAAVVAVAPAAPVAIEPVAIWSAADLVGSHPEERRPGRRRAALVAGATALAVALVAGVVWAAAGRPAGT
ncbi:serine/threonine-protein kinase, partial [Kitasatospora paranensis]